MKKKMKSLAFAISVALFMCLVGFVSCNGTSDSGSISIMLPYSQSREAEESLKYSFDVCMSGPTPASKKGESGQTIFFDELTPGDYSVSVKAYDISDGNRLYAEGSASTEVLVGRVSEVVIQLKKVHEHTWSDKWSKDDTNHWHECECGERSDETSHSYGHKDNGWQKCSVCDKTIPVSLDTLGTYTDLGSGKYTFGV